jgi:intein/homing endonuclease
LKEPGNHRVLRVEKLEERPSVYDLIVPGYHNFVCHGVVVHNTSYDIYADDSAMPDMERGQSIWVVSDNKTTENDLNDMLHKKVLIEEHIWGLERTIAKYGNGFGELLVSDQGLVGINFLPPPTMRRVEDNQGRLLGFIQDIRGEFNLSIEDFYKLAAQRGTDAEQKRPPGVLTVFEDWEVIQWRLRGKHLNSAYGHGIADPARWVWKRLVLLEDALLIYKLSRAPARFAFYIDIGEYDAERGLAYVNRVKNQFVKKKFINPCLTGETLVRCLDGTMRSMRELAEAGEDRWVYSFDLSRGKVVPGLAKNPRRTGEKVPVYRVVLDNGAVVRATGHHPFLMRDGVYRNCDQLKAGDRLMPLVLSKASGGRSYVRVKQPFDGRQELVQGVVARELWPEAFEGLKAPVVHHKDRVKSNNDPSNLEVTERSDHAKEHLDENLASARAAYVQRVKEDPGFGAQIAERLVAWRSRDPERVRQVMSEQGRKNIEARMEEATPLHDRMRDIITRVVERDPLITAQELVAELNQDPGFLEVYRALPTTQKSTISVGCLQAWLKRQGFRYYKEFKQSVVGHSRWRNSKYERRVGKGNNHRVVDVRFDGYEDVYNMDVEKYANFALVSGIFVHNSTGKMDMRHNPLCLAADTRIPLLNGGTRTVKEMAQAFERGEEQWVYSSDVKDEGAFVPGKVAWAGQTRKDAQLVKITLDNGKALRVTPDHKMIRRSGEFVEAQDLRPGDSLMPFRKRISAKTKGETLEGYELVYCPKAAKSLYTHRVVGSALDIKKKGQLLHHRDLNKLNNEPFNLKSMEGKAHRELHRRLGQSGGATIARRRKEDPEFNRRLCEANSRTIIRYNKSPEKRARTAELNRQRDQGRFIREYNRSEKHEEDNVIRSQAMKDYWADPEKRRSSSQAMQLKYPPEFIEGLRALIRENPDVSMDKLGEAATEVLLEVLQASNTRNVVSIHRHMIRKVARAVGCESYEEFKQDALDDNHKVVSVEWLEEREDTYTLTVTPAHTFAVSAGVFIKNSMDEDLFIPSRGGKDSTRVEVLQGPDYSETDTVEYHRDALVSALKVPKNYMGFGGESSRSALSSEDIRFARTVMRLQRETRTGVRKACRVHLIAKGADVDRHDYDVKMCVPSAILELANIEVMSATADLAQRTGEILSTKWVLTTLFKYSEQEAEELIQDKDKDSIRKAKVDAEGQRLLTIAQTPPEEPGAGAGAGGAETASKQMSSRDMLMLEKRIERLLKGHQEDVERNFDRKVKLSRHADANIMGALKGDPALGRRMRNIQGLLKDVRSTMYPTT